jgi:hypothetical protein
VSWCAPHFIRPQPGQGGIQERQESLNVSLVNALQLLSLAVDQRQTFGVQALAIRTTEEMRETPQFIQASYA